MTFSELINSVGNLGLLLCVAVLVITVFVVELIKMLIEKIRIRNTMLKILSVTNDDGTTDEKQIRYFNDGKEYKKLIHLYQSISFVLAFIGVGFVLYFYSNIINIAQLCIVSLVIALGEAKIYEIYEQMGIRGIFRWLGGKLTIDSNIANTVVDNKELAIAELKELINKTSTEVKTNLSNLNINEDELIKTVAKLKDKNPEIIKVMFDNIK